MNVLLVHNYYQNPGGEDVVFAAERDLLERYGHSVRTLTAHNDDVQKVGKLQAAVQTIWSRPFQRILTEELERVRPDIVHFHNTFMRISPAAYHTVRARGIPVIQSLHNFRLSCPVATFYRDGHVCEDCKGKLIPVDGVVHGCYRDSRSASAVVAAMLATHNALRTWTRKVDKFIALTEFGKRKHVEIGIPERQIEVKPNFIDPSPAVGARQGGYMLYVGRLTTEKGVGTLIDAWARLGKVEIPLKVVGDGPLMPYLREVVLRHDLTNVEILGQRPRAEVLALMQDAYAVVFPSEWYEAFGLTLVEAFACGTPVIASRMGVMEELVQEGCTGMHFQPGNPDDLAAVVYKAWSLPAQLANMGGRARTEFLARYTADHNYDRLIQIYRQVTEPAQSVSSRT